MRLYETAFLIAPSLPEEEMEKFISQLADIVSKKKGRMVRQTKWGKKKLAYPILKFNEAYYVFFLYEGEAGIITELERRFKQTDSVIRYLTVKVDTKANIRKKKKRTVKADKPATKKEEKKEKEGIPVQTEKEEKERKEKKEEPEAEDVKEKAPVKKASAKMEPEEKTEKRTNKETDDNAGKEK